MIIVNQDKTVIINFDKVSNIYVQKNRIEYQCPYIEDFYGVLGFYKTEERAKEVLKEIIAEYSEYLRLPGGVAIFKGGMDIQPNVFNVPKVFEMPEE